MSRPGYTVFVGRLSRKTHPKDLEDVFGRYGEFKRCDIKLGQSLSFSFSCGLYCHCLAVLYGFCNAPTGAGMGEWNVS
jgi:hypothetical protein